jgi:hypothetical protein
MDDCVPCKKGYFEQVLKTLGCFEHVLKTLGYFLCFALL